MAGSTTWAGTLVPCLQSLDVGRDTFKFGRIPRFARISLFQIVFCTISAAFTLGALVFSVYAVAATSPVGTTPGTFAVSPSGAATYSIPIFVPPGTNGMAPKLSLNYNSQAGNGLLGVGWSLGGLSVIHRCGAIISIDGFKGGVNYDANDKLCLDGERLIKISTTEYRTQHESWQQIIASDGSTNPTSFTVKAKDGTIHYYGYHVTSDARIEASPPNTGVVRLWALSRIEDRNGNYLTITYQEDNANGDYRPARIDYTGNGSVAPYNSVVFGYVEPQASRPDFVPLYEGGSVIKTLKRLTHVYTYAGTSLAREYRLAYDPNFGAVGRSRLISIEECGSDGVCLPKTQLGWQDGGTGFGASAEWANSNPWEGVEWKGFSDFNGDGKADLWYVVGGTTQVMVRLATSTGFAPATLWADGNTWDPCCPSWINFDRDFNGDGKADLVYSVGLPSQIIVRLSSGSSFLPAVQWANGIWGGYFEDFDGDGRADLVNVVTGFVSGSSTSRISVRLSTGSGFASEMIWANDLPYVPIGLSFKDFNGDGKTDLWYANGDSNTSQIIVRLSKGSSFLPAVEWASGIPYSGTQWAEGWQEQWTGFRDFNGDGKTDLWYVTPNTSQIIVRLSTGTTFLPPVEWANNNPWSGAEWKDFSDFNGDGKADLWYVTGGTSQVMVRLSTGSSFAAASEWANGNPWRGAGWLGFNYDFNGDGKTDFWYVTSGASQVIIRLANPPFPDFLTAITNGLGAQTTITYKPLTDSTVYTKDSGSVYPYQDIQNAIYVVSQYTQSNGISGTNTTTITYGGLKRHLTANAGLGFRWTRVTDPSGLVQVNYFNQTLNGTEGTVAVSETWAGNIRVKYVGNTWTPVTLGGGRALARLVSTAEETRELDNSVVTTVNTSYSNYDAFGNAGTVTVNFNDGWSKTTSNTYNNDTVNWQLGQLLQSQVTANAPGQTAQTRISSFTYDALGRLATETIEPNNTELWLTNTYAYDNFGNRWKKTVSGADITTRDEYILMYDTQGQFVTSKTNALEHVEYFENDHPTGTLTKHTDANGIQTIYAYDGFGRKTGESRPGSPTTTIYYTCRNNTVPASGNQCPTPLGLRVRTIRTASGQTYVDHDMLGRPVMTITQGLNGAWIYKTSEYDALGRVSRVSHPRYGNEAAHYTTYTYYPDALGRLWKVTEPGPGNRTTTTEYNGLSTTVTSPPTTASPSGQSKTTVKNSQGLVTSVTDAAGTTSYTYDPFGNLTNVTKSYDLNAPVAMAYDIRGRKTAMTDPDMGLWTYKYNTLGELTEQTDAKNQKIIATYDELGRMKTRKTYLAGSSTPETSSTWAYDTATYGKGKFQSVSNTNANETYVYNSLSQVSSVTISIGGITYTASYTYDSNGRVLTLTYPITGFKLYHVYNPYGYLTEVHKDTATGFRYWLAVSADAHGHLNWETLGNSLVSQRGYNHETGDLETIKTGSFMTGLSSVQNSSFSFDALDNLKSRSWFDGTTFQSETFGYDTLNRLTAVTGPANKTYNYHANGNITYKSDTGHYFYPTNGVRPHGVTQTVLNFSPTNYAYDANGNMTTRAGKTIGYFSFNKPKTIAGASGTTTLTYDANFNRLTKVAPGNTTTYIGKLYEKSVGIGGFTTHKHYLYAGNNLVGAYTSGGTPSTRYFHTDHLGSVEIITNETGGVIQRLSYDAWGKRRNANGTDASNIAAQTTRGFTRHEHDDEVTLINMNAREYDPVLGRFVSPDTTVQFPHHSQSYNRYAYVHNNPLSFTDPTGYGLFKSLKKAVKKVVKAAAFVATAYVFVTTGYAIAPEGFFTQLAGMASGAYSFDRTYNAHKDGARGWDLAKTSVGSGFGAYGTLTAPYYGYQGWSAAVTEAGSYAGGTTKFAAHHYVNGWVRDEVGEYAARHGYSLTEFNLGLFGLSTIGNLTPGIGSRLERGTWEKTDWGIRGWGNRGEIGYAFDVVDTVLAYQGLPTATTVHYLFSDAYGKPMTGHSLGALDVSNLSTFGLVGSGSHVYALPFGKIASGVGVSIGAGDPVNGFGFGKFLNWDANVTPEFFTGFFGHSCQLYAGCGQ